MTVVLVVTGGCGAVGDKQPAETKRSATPLNLDRELGAVLASLTRLDACELIDPDRAKAPGFAAGEPFNQSSPHTCTVRNSRGGAVDVDLLVPFTGYERWRGHERLMLGDAVGYLSKNTRCELVIPVSFEFAIKFSDNGEQQPTAGRCGQVRAFAAAAVPQLKSPAGTAPTRQAQWDACSLLGRALGSEQRPYSGAFDHCVVGKTRLRLQYSMLAFDPEEYREATMIAGRATGLTPSGDQCVLTMDQGPTGQQRPRPTFQRTVVAASTCPEAKKRATAVAGLLAVQRPPGQNRIQAPLYFRANEPEQAAAGGCAFVESREDFQDCEPYTTAEVPKAADLHEKAQADPHVLCAIAAEPVRERFGDELKPVVARQRCHFLQGGDRLTIVISSAPGRLQAESNLALSIDGRPAERKRGDSAAAFETTFRIGLGENHLLIDFSLFSTQIGSPPAPADAAVLAKIEPLVTSIVQRLK